MPRAVATNETTREELKTLPSGFVVFRKLNYGEILKRRSISQQMEMSEEEGTGKPQGAMVIKFDAVAAYEFARAIVDHNLENENDQPLNFNSVADVMKLDPIVAQEIEGLINRMNNYEENPTADRPLSSKSEEPSAPKESVSK